jgi:hypothetical protein
MTRALVSHWKAVVVSMMAVGLIAGLTLGTQLLVGKSGGVWDWGERGNLPTLALAAELASNSPEVEDALGSEGVQVQGIRIGGHEAFVTCAGDTGEFVTVQVDLEEKEVVKVTSHISPADDGMPDLDGETLETTTDELSYALGEGVTIEIANISPETITGGGVYYYVYDTEGNWVAGNGLFLLFELQPGEGLPSMIWNQTDKDGEQVEPGTYIIEGQAGDYSDAIEIHIGEAS